MSISTGFQKLSDTASDSAAYEFIVRQVLNELATACLVKVLTVRPMAGMVGYLDAQPLINQFDGAGVATPHGPINNLPYLRAQGGKSAIIIDPVAGDIGVAAFCSRDISAVKRTAQQSNPGSFRTYDMADGIYLGGLLNGDPTQYIQFLANGGGINIVSPGGTIDMSAGAGPITLTGYAITFDGPTTINGNLQVNGNINATGTISP